MRENEILPMPCSYIFIFIASLSGLELGGEFGRSVTHFSEPKAPKMGIFGKNWVKGQIFGATGAEN